MSQIAPLQRVAPIALTAALILICLAAYLHIAQTQNIKNRDMRLSDQSAYMEFAKSAYHTNFKYTGGRARMPLYPWIQALFYSPELSDEAFFQQGKRLNIILSTACLFALGVAFFYRFTFLYATYSIVVIAFLMYSIQAPFFKAELLFFTLFALTFAASIESIRRPTWYWTLTVGLLFSAAHFAKASALPMLAIYVFSFSVPIVSMLLVRNRETRAYLTLISRAAAPTLIFVFLLFPYFNESKERYGHFLYNVTTTFYIWYDSWDEAKQGTRAAGDRLGWPDLPAEEIPSLAKYLDEHSVSEIVHRFQSGARNFIEKACTSAGSPQRLGYCGHLGVGLLILIASVAGSNGRLGSNANVTSIQTGLFLALVFSAYLLSSFWAWPITMGPRVTLTLLIPYFWTVGLMLETPRLRTIQIDAPGHRTLLWNIVYAVLIFVVLVQTYELVTFRAARLYGGI